VSYRRYQTVLRTMLQFFCSTKQLSFFLYGRDTYDIAEPEKALCDLVYLRYRWARELSEDRMRSLLDDMDLAELHKVLLRRYVRLMRLEDSFRQLEIAL
jgi:hypothetical protein